MTKHREALPEELARRATAAGSMDALKASGAFDELMAQIDSGQLELDGKDGFIQQLIKASLERGLQAELSGHLGYDKGDPAGRATAGIPRSQAQHGHRRQPGLPMAFPRPPAGQAMDPGSLRDLLQEIGIPTQTGRTAAIRQPVLQMPPPVVAQALGYHHTSTTRIAAEAGSPWSEYAPGDHSR